MYVAMNMLDESGIWAVRLMNCHIEKMHRFIRTNTRRTHPTTITIVGRHIVGIPLPVFELAVAAVALSRLACIVLVGAVAGAVVAAAA